MNIDVMISFIENDIAHVTVGVGEISYTAYIPIGKQVSLPTDLLDPDASGVDDLSSLPGHLIDAVNTSDQLA